MSTASIVSYAIATWLLFGLIAILTLTALEAIGFVVLVFVAKLYRCKLPACRENKGSGAEIDVLET